MGSVCTIGSLMHFGAGQETKKRFCDFNKYIDIVVSISLGLKTKRANKVYFSLFNESLKKKTFFSEKAIANEVLLIESSLL